MGIGSEAKRTSVMMFTPRIESDFALQERAMKTHSC